MILPRTGRGSEYVKALRAAILERIETHKGTTRNELERTICLEWNMMARSFNHHFNDMTEFGLVAGDDRGLRITPSGREYLKSALQDHSIGQGRTGHGLATEKKDQGEEN